jgi:hypothetical protein
MSKSVAAGHLGHDADAGAVRAIENLETCAGFEGHRRDQLDVGRRVARFTENTATLLPRLIVIKLRPSMVVSALMVLVRDGNRNGAAAVERYRTVEARAAGETDISSATSVQLADAPAPTTRGRMSLRPSKERLGPR